MTAENVSTTLQVGSQDLTEAQDATALADCPFCGSKPNLREIPMGLGSPRYQLFCGECGVRNATAPTAGVAIVKWNSRAAPQTPDARIIGCGDPRCHDPNCAYGKADTPSVSAGPQAKAKSYEAARENLREAWAALAMIRETVEMLAPSGSVKGAEYLDGPTFTHEACALVDGIIALAAHPQPQQADVRRAVIEIPR